MARGGSGAAPVRCSAAALDAGDDLAGSASTVRRFLLVQAEGPWGVEATQARQLPPPVAAYLAELERATRIRPLLIRSGRRAVGHRAGIRVFLADTRAGRARLRHTLLDGYEELLDLDLRSAAEPAGLARYDEPLFCVCTHGRHDVCCAERGRPAWEAIAGADVEHAWQVSHIGGDRFAGNVLVLPEGLYYGRVTRAAATELVAAHRRGHLLLNHLRGRASYPFAVQAAEIFLRRHLDVTELDALTLLEHDRDGAETTARFAVAGRQWRVRVRTTRGPARRLTCRTTVESAPLRQQLVAIE